MGLGESNGKLLLGLCATNVICRLPA